MANNLGILEKVSFLLNKAKAKEYSKDEFDIIMSYTEEHTDNLVSGRVFGYSISEYAISTLKWIGSEESLRKYDEIMAQLPESRKRSISELIKSEMYKQV